MDDAALQDLVSDSIQLSERVAVIARNARRIEEVLESMTEAYDLTAGTLPIEPVMVGMDAVVLEAMRDAAPALEAHPVDLELAPGAVVLADPRRLRQILVHLLVNAGHYSPAGSEIHVSSSVASGRVLLRVVDHGPGLPPERVSEAFRRFARLHRNPPGLGSGLFLARNLARAHGGDVTHRPAVGGGAELQVTLIAR